MWKHAPPEIEGIPEGVDRDELNQICTSHLNDSISFVSYVHLSAWKVSGAYRISMRTKKGIQWSLVYKNSQYLLGEIPALDLLHVWPGPPEYQVYTCREDSFVQYLPSIYLCREVIPGIRYEYLLEDLSREYQKISRNNYDMQAVIKVVEELPVIHAVMNRWVDDVDQHRLITYDHEFSLGLQKYARTNLEQYYSLTLDSMVAKVLKEWSQICRSHRCLGLRKPSGLFPVHGDFNTDNIWIHKDSQRLKMVDWEWSGFGLPHADLASLLSTTSLEIEEKAIKIYADQNTQFSPNEHNLLYEWCKLERGLLDSSFIAAQYVNSPRERTNMDMATFVHNSMRRVLLASHNVQEKLGEETSEGFELT